jgi:hypothetical protein
MEKSRNNLYHMGIREDFAIYLNQWGLLDPSPVGPGTGGGSDNGVLYTSQYYIMLAKLGLLTAQDKADFAQKIGQCIDSNGILSRFPIGHPSRQESVDDMYGLMSACITLGNTDIPRKILWATAKYKGSLDNVNPGSWQWGAFLIRQPQLLACIVSAAFPSWHNPLHIIIRKLFFPFFIIAAIILALSCFKVASDDSDSRLLSWSLWQTLKTVSPICWLAGRLWRNRLYGTYGPAGMQAVAGIYFQPHPDNPYSKWWITE